MGKKLDFQPVKVAFLDKTCEMQAISLPQANIIIINVYRPFGDLNTFFDTLEKTLEDISISFPNSEIIMVGDFNIDLNKSSSAANRIIELGLYFDMVQQVTIPTRIQGSSQTIIDHVYVKSKQHAISNVIMTDISDHFATTCITQFHRTKVATPSTKVTKRWLTAETYEYLRILLRHENWDQMESMNCETATAFLVDKITEAMDIVAPIETKEIKGNTIKTLGRPRPSISV